MGLDERARAAASDLREHADQTVDAAAALGAVTSRRDRHRRRARVLVGASVAAMAIAATIVVVVARPTDDVRVGTDEDAETGHTTTIPTEAIPAAPDDGLDSIGLPVTAEPTTQLVDGQVVTLTGTGFLPGEQVGLVECVRQEDDVNVGADGCDLTLLSYAIADDRGVVNATFAVRRLVSTPHNGFVDCGESPERCSIGMGAVQDYDRSGGVRISFDASVAPPEVPALEVTWPAGGATEGDPLTFHGRNFTPNTQVWVFECEQDSSCTPIASLNVAGDGTFEGAAGVSRYLPALRGGTMDCASYPSACFLRAGEAEAALVFDPDAPARPRPQIEATPGQGVRQGETITVTGTGFATPTVFVHLCPEFGDQGGCANAPLSEQPVGVDGTVSFQLTADRALPLVLVSETDIEQLASPPLSAAFLLGFEA